MLKYIHPQLHDLALPIDSLNEDPNNANKHGGRNLAAIAESFKRFGQRKPLVVRREGMIVEAGNGTLAALRAEGWTHLACVVCDDDEQTAMAYGLADNQAARLAEWDFGNLQANVEALLGDGYDVGGLGWSGDELADILAGKADALDESLGNKPNTQDDKPPPASEDNPKDDEIPEPPLEPITKLGDVWQLGDHRLICGDCRDPEVVARLLDGDRINVAFTSPPYASQRKYDESSGFKPIHPDAFVDWFEAVQSNVCAHLAEDGSWFVNIKAASEVLDTQLYVLDLVLAHARQWGWHFATEFCWSRTGLPGKPRRRFKNQFEPVYQFARNEWKFRPEAVQHPTNAVPTYNIKNQWAYTLDDSNAGGGGSGWVEVKEGLAYPGNRLPVFGQGNETHHVASFPVGLPSFFVKAYSDPGDIVYDPFMGSGTTIIACEREGRRGRGCEISPRYCDVIIARWETATGRKAERLT